MALGSSCFGLLFLASGSTFGSTSPPLSGGAILPLLFIIILWVVNPKGVSWSRRDKRENHRADLSFGFAGRAFPASSVTKHRARGPRTACCASSHSYWGFGGGEFRTRGTRFSEFPAESSRWDPRRAHRPRLLVEAPRPIGRGNILGISGDAARRAVSDFLLQ